MEGERVREKRMEQNTTSSSSSFASATADEITVAQILLDLKKMMSLSESLSNWGRRRLRSCLEVQPPIFNAPSRPQPSPGNRVEEKNSHIKAAPAAQEENLGVDSSNTGSPDTPLDFSPSESDDKPKHSSKKSSKKKWRRREEYLDMIKSQTQRKDLLTGELKKVRKYYDKLKAYNSRLKQALKTQHYRTNMETHLQPLAADQTAQECQHSFGPIAAHSQPSDDGLGSGGPWGFDLNLPAPTEEAFSVGVYWPLDAVADRRARFAEARRKRIRIIKTKSRGL